MDVKKFSLPHGSVVECSSFDVLKKSVSYISDSDRSTLVVVTEDNEVWTMSPNTSRFVFAMGDLCEVSSMCFLPSSDKEENCAALTIFDCKSGESSLKIMDLVSIIDIYSRASAFPGRVTALAPVEPLFHSGTHALAFGLENGNVGVFSFSGSSSDLQMIETGDIDTDFPTSPVRRISWLKTRRLLICGYDTGFLSVFRLPSKEFVFGHQLDPLPINCIVSTEPENDPRQTCFVWVSAANGRRSSAAIIFRIEGENDNVICMGVHDLAVNIPECDSEKSWAYLVEIASSKQIATGSSEGSLSSSNLISFLWEIGVTGKSTDYYFALFDINAWFSWQSQANLHLKEPDFGGSKFLSVFRLPKSVNGDNRLQGAFAISSSITPFRPRVSVVPLTSPLLYPCSLSFDILCVCADSIARVHFPSLQETLLKNSVEAVDFGRFSDHQLAGFVDRLTTLGLIDMFDGSSIGCSSYESVLNAFFKFANESEAVRFCRKITLDEDFIAIFRNWVFFRAVVTRKDFDICLNMVFEKSDATEHLKAVESDMLLISRLVSALPTSSLSFIQDLKRAIDILVQVIAKLLVLLKPPFRALCFEAFSLIPYLPAANCTEKNSMFCHRTGLPLSDVFSSREKFVNCITSSASANKRFDNSFILLYTLFYGVDKTSSPDDIERLLTLLTSEFQLEFSASPSFVRYAATACFLDRKMKSALIRKCLVLSRPLLFTPEDQVHLLKHLSDDDNFAFEVAVQLLAYYQSETCGSTSWTNGVLLELLKLFVDIFLRKNCFEPILRLCLSIPSESERSFALLHIFKLACSSTESVFVNFMRKVSCLSAQCSINVLRECIRFMCNSKERLLLERACIFYAEKGPAFLPEALAIANKASEMKLVLSKSGSSMDLDALVSHRRRLIEKKLVNLPDFVRQRLIDKSHAEDTMWMFSASSVGLPWTNTDHQLTPPDSDVAPSEPHYQFDWEEIEKLLVVASNSPIISSSSTLLLGLEKSIPSYTSSVSSIKRSASAVSSTGSGISTSQLRSSVAKKCRFVDSADPANTTILATTAAPAALAPNLVPSGEPMTVENLPVTPVIKNYPTTVPPLPMQPSQTLVQASSTVSVESCIVIDDSEEDEDVMSSSNEAVEMTGNNHSHTAEEPASTSSENVEIAASTLSKRLSFSSLKKPSPAQKAARRIVKRSVRFSCSPRVVIDNDTIEMYTAVSTTTAIANTSLTPEPLRATLQSNSDIVEIISSDDSGDGFSGGAVDFETAVAQFSTKNEDHERSADDLYLEDSVRAFEDESEEEEEEDCDETETADIYLSPMSDTRRISGSLASSSDGDRVSRFVVESLTSVQLASGNLPKEIDQQRPESHVVEGNNQETFDEHNSTSPAKSLETSNLSVLSDEDKQKYNIRNVAVVVEPMSDISIPEPSINIQDGSGDTNSGCNNNRMAASSKQNTRGVVPNRLIKSVSNLSPNRLAAQKAVRRSHRIMSNKKRMDALQDSKQPTSSSLVENAEPTPPSPIQLLAVNDDRPGSSTLARQTSVIAEGEDAAVVENSADKAVAMDRRRPQRHQKEQQPSPTESPVRLTRSRSAAVPTEASSSQVVERDGDVTKRNLRKTHEDTDTTKNERLKRHIEPEPLVEPSDGSVSSSASFLEVPGVKTRGRVRRASGSSVMSEISERTVDVGARSSKRTRTQTASRSSSPATGDKEPALVSPGRRTRKTPVVAPQSEAALPPRRKRTQLERQLGDRDMVTPSSSPKRKLRNAPAVSASVTKVEPEDKDELSSRRLRSAPSSPGRRTRATGPADHTAQLAAALKSITDSPAFHTRQHGLTTTEQQQSDHVQQQTHTRSSRASSICGSDDAVAVSVPVSPTNSTVSTASSRVTRSTRRKTTISSKTVNR